MTPKHPLDCRRCGRRAMFDLATKIARCPWCEIEFTPKGRHFYLRPPGRNATEADRQAWEEQIRRVIAEIRDIRRRQLAEDDSEQQDGERRP